MKNQDLRNLKRKSSLPRCVITNKLVGSRPVVLTENAEEYVRKLGFSVEHLVWRKPLSPKVLNRILRAEYDE